MTTTTSTSPPASSPRKQSPQSLLAAWPAMLALCLAMLVEMLDNTLFTIALPTIGRDLGAGTTGLQWITAAYSLTFGGLLLVGGTIGDLYGRRRALLIGIVGFGASSALVLACTQTWHLVGVRALVGVFAALIAPGTMSLTYRLFDDDALRQKAIGVIVAVAMLGFALGPILSGLAIEHLPWQFLLVVNVPVALIAFLGVRFGIAADDPQERRGSRLDLPGALLSVTALASGLYAFTAGVEHGWASAVTIGSFALAVLAGAGFVHRENHCVAPMLDLRLVKRPTVRGSALIQTAVMTAMVGTMYGLTLHFQYAWGWSPLRAGFANIPFVVAMFAAAPLVDKVIAAVGQRRASVIGGCTAVVGLAFMALAVTHSYPFIAAGIMVQVTGIRMVMSSAALALLGDLPDDHTSIGAAMNDTAQELGNGIGVAIVGTVMAVVIGTHLPSGAWPSSLAHEFIHAERVALLIITGLVAAIVALGARSLTDSTATDEH